MKKIMLISFTFAALLLCGCGQKPNDDVKSSGSVVAKKVGGTANIVLPPKQKLVAVTWKRDEMWLLYRPFRKGEFAEEYTYREDSVLGVLEATLQNQGTRINPENYSEKNPERPITPRFNREKIVRNHTKNHEIFIRLELMK